MSRSRKKTAGWCDRSPWFKTYWNRKFRRFAKRIENDVDDGCWYRKYSCSYSICDYKFLYYTKGEVRYELERDNWYWHINPIPYYKYYMK